MDLPGREIANDTDTTFSRPSVSQLLAEICTQTLLPAIFLLSSDIFVTLRWVRLFESLDYVVCFCPRTYAVTSYLVTLASARFLTLLMETFLPRSKQYDVSTLDSKPNLTSVSISTAFGT